MKNHFEEICRNCTKRSAEPNCHTDCKQYISFCEELHKIAEAKRISQGGRYNPYAHSQEKGKRYT